MSPAQSASAAGSVAPDDPDALAALLLDAENRLAEIPLLQARIGELERELADAGSELAAVREEALRLDQMLMYGRRALRLVRPLIVPLRDLRHRMHG